MVGVTYREYFQILAGIHPFLSMYIENTKEIKIFFNVISRHLENQNGGNFHKNIGKIWYFRDKCACSINMLN